MITRHGDTIARSPSLSNSPFVDNPDLNIELRFSSPSLPSPPLSLSLSRARSSTSVNSARVFLYLSFRIFALYTQIFGIFRNTFSLINLVMLEINRKKREKERECTFYHARNNRIKSTYKIYLTRTILFLAVVCV